MTAQEEREYERLRWRCRRGLLELDLVLGHFLEQRYRDLPPAEREAFAQLLEEADQDLLGWVHGEAEPSNPELRQIVARIRQLFVS